MTAPISVLLYGRDPHLLQTRQWVLEASGYQVWTATEIHWVDRITAIASVDLLILCHSLSLEECEHALALTCCRQPRMRKLLLAADPLCSPAHILDKAGLLDDVLDTMEGPAKLVSTVEQLVGSVTSAHTH